MTTEHVPGKNGNGKTEAAVAPAKQPGDYVAEIPVSRVVLKVKENARGLFGERPEAENKAYEQGIEDLANSISKVGLLSPITVRPIPEKPEHFELIAGERRYRAIVRLGWKTINCQVKVAIESKFERLHAMGEENVGRKDLSSAETAAWLSKLKRESKTDDGKPMTNAQLARYVGKSETFVQERIHAWERLIPEWLRAWKGEAGVALSDKEAFRLAALPAEKQKLEWEEKKAKIDQEAGGEVDPDQGRVRGSGERAPSMAKRPYIEELLRAFQTKKKFLADAEKVRIGGKWFDVEELQDDAISFARTLLGHLLDPKGTGPVLRYREFEVEAEEGG